MVFMPSVYSKTPGTPKSAVTEPSATIRKSKGMSSELSSFTVLFLWSTEIGEPIRNFASYLRTAPRIGKATWSAAIPAVET